MSRPWHKYLGFTCNGQCKKQEREKPESLKIGMRKAGIFKNKKHEKPESLKTGT
jgi:hypothetical protein